MENRNSIFHSQVFLCNKTVNTSDCMALTEWVTENNDIICSSALAFAWRAGNEVLTWLHSQSDNHVPSHQGADLLPCSDLLLVALLEQLLVHVA